MEASLAVLGGVEWYITVRKERTKTKSF